MVFTDTIGGIAVADPFRWLEDDADPVVVDWQKQQDERAVAELAASPHAAAVSAAVRKTYEDVFTYAAPQRFGSTWFRTVRPAGRAGVVLEVAASPTGEGRVLVDPSDDGPDVSIAYFHPSPDGMRVIVALDVGGVYRIRILDAADGKVVRNLGDRIATAFFTWTADGEGFFFQVMSLRMQADGPPVPESQIWFQTVDGDAQRIELELDHPVGWPMVSSDGRWAAVVADQTAPRPRWVSRLGSGKWNRFLPDATGMYKGVFVGDEFWAVTNDLSGWCRLVAIPVETADDRSTWRELVPAKAETKLASISLCGDYVSLATIESGVMRMRSLDLQGKDLAEVELPGDGAFGRVGVGHIMAIMGDIVIPDGDGCVFVHSTLSRSPGVYRADLASRKVEELVAPVHVLADRTLERFSAEGPNGQVSYWVVRKASTPLDGSAPVIVTGYGGFNVPWIPYYSAMAAAWTELGGIWVHAHLRGGGERDDAFWREGRMHRKQGTFDDFHAVIDDLHTRGFARPERTGVWGSSNGGLLVGAAVTQRPDLLRAAVAQVPILDVLQCRKDPGTIGICMADYGNPDDPADAPVLHAYSPYHRVREGVSYPALFCDAGAHDMTCPPWHSRKMAAAVQAASASDLRTLMRARGGAGHNQMTTERAIERDVEELTFFCDELMG